MAACKLLHAALENRARVAINPERICDQAARGDQSPPERIVQQLRVELVSASPTVDDQLLESCQTSSSTQPAG